MFASRFNLLFDLPNGSRGLYNCRSRALIELDDESRLLVPDILAEPGGEAAARNPGLLEQLHFGGFLLDHQNELADLKIANDRHRFGRSLFALAIAPTFACNLDCPGCQGKRFKRPLGPQIEKSLLSFASDRIRRADRLQTLWFGGEPLLGLDQIERVQGAIAEQAERFAVERSPAVIITNGTLLGAESAHRLQAAGIGTAEVTLAGTRDTHDRARPTAQGQGTFATILGNLQEAVEVLDLVLRLPGDPDRKDDTLELVCLLERHGLLGRTRVYFAPTAAHGGACASLGGRCDQAAEGLNAQLDLYRHLAELPEFPFAYPYLLPQERCGFDSENASIVAPTGYIFRCWEEVAFGVDLSVGSVFQAECESFQSDNQRRFAAWDPFARSDCPTCSLLPVCMGGCAHFVPEQHRGKCRFWRDHHLDLQSLHTLFLTRKEVS